MEQSSMVFQKDGKNYLQLDCENAKELLSLIHISCESSRPLVSEVLKLSIVSVPKISDISLRVVFSLPPKKRVVSQLPTMVSALSL